MKVAVLGYGAIGARVSRALHAGDIIGVEFLGVHTRTPSRARADGIRALDRSGMIANADLVVECAGVAAVHEVAPAVIAAGKNLLLTSVGAVADLRMREVLLRGGSGRTFLTSGAVGGLDILAAAALGGGIEQAALTTTKPPRAVIGPWMDAATQREILGTAEALTVFEGSVDEAIERFPASLNVAVALAAATDLWEQTTVKFVADPSAVLTRHEITASGAAGSYRFEIQNRPDPNNPATSGVVADAVLQGIRTLVGVSGAIL